MLLKMVGFQRIITSFGAMRMKSFLSSQEMKPLDLVKRVDRST